ncbi:MAG: hypothetical protein DYG84_15275 [Candidatus Brocadia sp. AMX3]|nr:hypothetical protein [Candidatus Brocadia sp. AMX3]
MTMKNPMKNKKAFLFVSVGMLSLAVLFTAGEAFGQRSNSSNSWTPPTQQFPGGNTTPPVDVGSDSQIKSGELGTSKHFFSTSPGAAFISADGSYIKGGNNSLYLSTGGGTSLLLNLTSPFIVNTKGLVLYNNGQAWLFTGPLPPPGGGNQNQSSNGLLNGANAQANVVICFQNVI